MLDEPSGLAIASARLPAEQAAPSIDQAPTSRYFRWDTLSAQRDCRVALGQFDRLRSFGPPTSSYYLQETPAFACGARRHIKAEFSEQCLAFAHRLFHLPRRPC
eukprot:5301780-Prymnesium_polylepis.1